ncbi:hypothetical protein CHU98_g8853, partial [Xylaria longipes]
MAGKRHDDDDSKAGFADGPATATTSPETHFGDDEGEGEGEGEGDRTNDAWFEHSSGKRIDTDTLIARSLARQYPSLQLTIAPR